ncbi:MAG: hypothetical protein RL641_84 [Candidatus Parcubacteria bacterium]|jgi:hypothetical protein
MGIEEKWNNNNEGFDAVMRGLEEVGKNIGENTDNVQLEGSALEKEKNETVQMELLKQRQTLVKAIANTDDFARKGLLEEELANLEKKMESVDNDLSMAA